MEQHFLISSDYEYQFWEMAYRLERWPSAELVKSR